ncbi:hypothetical protein EDB83DRAFT_2230874, partial [Lactarius deliciosus]
PRCLHYPWQAPQDRVPDWVTEEQTSAGQALIYRLSGDYNPLQPKDPGPGSSLILHGLSTLGFAAHALVRMVRHRRPSSLRSYLDVRFTAPVAPGDGLETSALNVGTGPDGVNDVALEVKNTRTGKPIPQFTRADRTSVAATPQWSEL